MSICKASGKQLLYNLPNKFPLLSTLDSEEPKMMIYGDVKLNRLRKSFENLWYTCLALKYLIEQEKEFKSDLSLWKRIWSFFHGFSSSKYELYNLKENNYKLYLSDFQRCKTVKINGPYSLIIDDKAIFEKMYNNLTAKIYGKVKNGKVMLDNQEKSFDELLELIMQQKKVIIKKFRGGGGKGIHRVSWENNIIYLDGQSISTEGLNDFICNLSNYLVMEHLTQASYSNNIYSGTINSIRILTMIDPDTNKAFIPLAVHKFGSEKTKPADNVWKGGMTALIDIKTGRLGKPAYHHDNNNKITWEQYHPDTNMKIEGTVIPNWEQIKSKVIDTVQLEDNLKYVGWDVVVTDNGIKIIEGNNYSDVNILQIHQPLLSDQRVKKFYEHHGII